MIKRLVKDWHHNEGNGSTIPSNLTQVSKQAANPFGKKTFGALKENVRSNLRAANIATPFYSQQDFDDSFQDAYDDIAFTTQCIVKKVEGYPWQDDVGYIDPIVNHGIFDFLGVTAIINNNTNLWLRDDVTIRDFDRIRKDWEVWYGQPQMWAPVNFKYFVVVPKQKVAVGTYDMIYWATAPKITDDTEVPLIASDMLILFEQYVTGDLLEQAEEFTKASKWMTEYYTKLQEYATRCKNLAKHDLALRV